MKDYSELKRLAEAATLGPWLLRGKQSIRGSAGEYIAKCNWNNGTENASFITAANPAAVLALIAERDAYRAALEGGGYRMLDNMTERGPDFARAIGAAAATLTMGIQQKRDQLKAEVESLRKDAERYRYLRNGAYCVATIEGYRVICEEPMPGPFVDADAALDASIDAAMSKEPNQ